MQNIPQAPRKRHEHSLLAHQEPELVSVSLQMADLRFTPIMDGNATIYEHTDKDETTFQSVAMWSYDDRLGAPIFFRFSGTQGTIKSSAGMFIGGEVTDSSPVFTAGDLAGPPWKPDRFLRDLSEDDILKMTWEVEKDDQMSFGDRILVSARLTADQSQAMQS